MKHGVVLVAVALAIGGCAGQAGPGSPGSPGGGVETAGCRYATSPPAMEIDGTPQPANQEALGVLADRLRTQVEQPFAEVFAGLAMEQERNRVVVYRVPSAALDKLVMDQFAADCVELRDAAHSAGELTALANKITDDMSYWRGLGIEINMVGASYDGSGVEVGVTGAHLEKAKVELPKRYGAGAPIIVVEAGPITTS